MQLLKRKCAGKTIHLIPNMADCEFYTPTTKDDELIEKYQVRDKFVISYIGAIGVANGLDYVLECARAAGKSQLPIHFFICGDGAVLDRLKGKRETIGVAQPYLS
jgi:glycosyltransferase involved in cell wall biosynthesis